jgi:hypothetical protein
MQRPTGTIGRSFTATTTTARPSVAPPRAMPTAITRSTSVSSITPTLSARPPPPPSNAPSVEFRQHHEVRAPEISTTRLHPGWRVHSRLASLAESGRIERNELDAAATWGQWAERIDAPITSAWRIRVDGGQLSGDSRLTNRRLDAAGWLRASTDAWGPGGARCCRPA